MKFEKISKDKIKVTLNNDDLTKNDLDFHSFMSGSDETHSLFLDVLEQAERDYGFSTKNYSLKVETVALSNGSFILTITRVSDNTINPSTTIPAKKKPQVSRKIPKIDSTCIIYKFESFDDFCEFSNYLYKNSIINYSRISKDSKLYQYKDNYYLILLDINIKSHTLKNLFSLLTEFSTYMDVSDIFIGKLNENGTLIFKHKAIQNCIKFFVKNNANN